MPGGARSWLMVSVCSLAARDSAHSALQVATASRRPNVGAPPLPFIFRYLCAVSWFPSSYLNTQHWRCSFVDIQMYLPASQADSVVVQAGLHSMFL